MLRVFRHLDINMDPKIWSQLPWDLIERIAHFITLSPMVTSRVFKKRVLSLLRKFVLDNSSHHKMFILVVVAMAARCIKDFFAC